MKKLFLILLVISINTAWAQENQGDTPSQPTDTPAQPTDTPQQPANTPQQPAGTPQQNAADAAARQVGRVIGDNIGYEVINQMKEPDRFALLERARAATRGTMIKKYNFESSPYYNELSGYITVLREGKSNQGERCLQYEIDLVYRVQRYFLQPALCQAFSGDWYESSLARITFPDRGAGSPVPGGWLPPIH